MERSVYYLRTLLKTTSPFCCGTGTKKGVYSVTTSVITKFRDQQLALEKKSPDETLDFPVGIARAGRLHFFFQKCYKTHRNLAKFKFMSKHFVVLNSLQTIEQTLGAKNTAEGRMPTFFQKYVFDNKGFSFNDLTTTSQRQKEIVRNVLSYQIRNNNRIISEEISRTVDQFLCSKGDVDSNIYIKQFLTNVFSRLLTGESLADDDPDGNALWELIDLLYIMLDPSIDTPLRMFPFLRFLPLKYGQIYKDTVKARDKVASKYFGSQKETYEDGRIRGLVDVCLKMQKDEVRTDGRSWLTDDHIKGLMYDTIAAGMTEMMKSIRMLILLMCHHQDIQSRVYAEIADVIGTGCDVRAEHRDKMPYTEAVILEMLRYISQTPLAIPHKCNNDVVLDGHLIEKNSGIFPNIWSIHHDDDIWGDPWCFRPDRFLSPEGSLLPQEHKLRKTLIPFSVGRRRCPGENFAMSGIFILFSTMIQKVHFLPPKEEQLPSCDPRLYNNKFPLYLPVFKCRAVARET